MTQPKNIRLDLSVLLCMIAIMLVLRLVWDYTCPINLFNELNDPKEYVKLAKNLVEYDVYGSQTTPDFFWPPFWPFFLANLAHLNINMTDKTILYVLEVIFLIVFWGITQQVGFKLWQRTVAVLIYVINPCSILLSNQFFSEHLYLILFNGALFLLFQIALDLNPDIERLEGNTERYHYNRRGINLKSIIYAIVAGILLGCAALTRGVVFPLIVFFCILTFVSIRKKHLFRIPVYLWMVTVIIALLPVIFWTYRNWKVTDQIVIISANSAENLWLGHNENIEASWLLPHSPYRERFKGMNLLELHEAWREEAIDYIKRHPIEAILKCGIKIRSFLNAELYGWSHMFNSQMSTFIRVVFRAGTHLIFALTVLGLIMYILFTYILPIKFSNYWSNLFLTFFVVVVLFFIFQHCVIRAQPRYRAALEPYLWMGAIAGFTKLFYARKQWIANIGSVTTDARDELEDI